MTRGHIKIKRYRKPKFRPVPKPPKKPAGPKPVVEHRPGTISASAPWEAEGISRSVWYKRRRAELAAAPKFRWEMKTDPEPSPTVAETEYKVRQFFE